MKNSTGGLSSSVLLLALFSSLVALSSAQLTGLPNLSTVTQAAGATNTGGTAATSKATGKHTSGDSSAATTAASSTATGIVHLSGLPTLSGVTIPTLVIPDTSDAPFMQKSSLPEGTIFICVGAILGFLGMCVLAWRGLIAWSLHRSVRRAAASQYLSDKKPRYQASGTYSTQNVSMENLSNLNTSYAGGKGQSKHPRTVTPNSSLFFSPTAGAGMYNHPNRNSSGYLPAGYYASGTAMPAAGAGVSHLGVGPGAAGYGRLSSLHNQSISPPDSPHMRPSDRPGDRGSAHSGHRPYSQPRHGQGGGSTSSLNMPPQSRTPSAYLDDMFDKRGHGPRERH